MLPRKRVFLAVFLISSVLLSACSGFSKADPYAQKPLKIAWNAWPGDYPIILAEELGLYEKYGAEVETIYSEDYSQQLAQLLSGEIDSFNATISDVLLMANTDDLQIVLVSDYPQGANVIIGDASIQTPRDLKGKRLGVDASVIQSQLLVAEMLKAYGLSIDDVRLVSIIPEEVPEALGETIDAGFTWGQFVTEAIKKGNKVVYSDAEAPGLLTDVLIFRRTTVEERPEDIQAVVAAWIEAAGFLNANPDQAVEMIARHSGLSQDEVSLEGVKVYTLRDNLSAFQFGDDFSSLYFTINVNQNFLRDQGYISKFVPLERLIQTSFLTALSSQ